MSLTEPLAILVSGLGGSVIAGGFSLLLGRRKTKPAEVLPTQKQVEAALRKRVTELEAAMAVQTERHVAFIEAQLEDRDRTIAQLTGREKKDD